MCRMTISDGISQLDFYEVATAPNIFDTVQWTYLLDTGLIRTADFGPEPINNTNNGIPGGKFPRKADAENIAGYTLQLDANPSLSGTITRCNQIDSRTAEFWYSAVNEFYQRVDPVCGGYNAYYGLNDVEVRNTYALDGNG